MIVIKIVPMISRGVM